VIPSSLARKSCEIVEIIGLAQKKKGVIPFDIDRVI
jgi:hypothetical protein